MICGGVAISNGDFWCTRMVDRCLFALGAWERVTGEKAAMVGGFGSLLLAIDAPSSSLLRDELGVEDIIQGVSCGGVWSVYACSPLQ